MLIMYNNILNNIYDTKILTYHIKCVEMIEQLTYETYTYYIVFA